MSDLQQLTALAPEPTTEIFLIDASLARIATAIGKLEVKVAPGLYKLRYRSGSTTFDQLVEVSGVAPVSLAALPPLPLETALPLPNSGRDDADQAVLARRLFQTKPPSDTPAAASVLIFHRESVSKAALSGRDIVLCRLGGERVLGLSEGTRDDQNRTRYIRAFLEPGTYGLRLDVGASVPIETFITLCPGWETQIFLDQAYQTNSDSERVPTLRNASIVMSRLGAAPPSDIDLRCLEMLRIAHAQGRPAIAKHYVGRWLEQADPDPIAGLYIAHALLAAKGRRSPSTLKVLTKLGAIGSLGMQHPDVCALMLHLTKDAHQLKSKHPTMFDLVSSVLQTVTHALLAVTQPPTFRASWDLLVDLSKRRATIIPADSFNAQLGGNLVSGTLWLTREIAQRPAFIRDQTVSIAAARKLEPTVRADPELAGALLKRADLNLTHLERNVLQSVYSARRTDEQITAKSNVHPPNGTLVTKLVNESRAPAYTAANAIANVSTLLTRFKPDP